jgi:hypothetical protein
VREGVGGSVNATASVHVVSTSRTHLWRALTLVRRTKQALRRADGIRFSVCGRSSAGRGHRDVSRSVTPFRAVVVVEWESPQHCATGRHQLATALGAGSTEVWSAALVPIRSNGTWRGEPRFAPTSTAPTGARAGIVASLTYAQVRPTRLFHFYVRGFPSAARQATGAHSSMLAGLGFGPVPVRHACTVSFWPTTDDVDGFAYGNGRPHDAVQRRSRNEGWLSESLFARFAVSDHGGEWAGSDPLAGRMRPAPSGHK